MISGQCVPAIVAQWAVEPGGKDVHIFFIGATTVGGTRLGYSTQEEEEEEENSVDEQRGQERLIREPESSP